MSQTILVTGGSGRLGRSVVTGLAEQGHRVISVDRTAVPGAPAEQILTDLSDLAAFYAMVAHHRPDALLHLAADTRLTGVPGHQIFGGNVVTTYGVVQAAVDLGVASVVTASSPTVMGYSSPTWRPERLPLDEDCTPVPASPYALSKLVAEQVVATFAAARHPDTSFASFRPCFVVAPDEWAGAPTQTGHTVRQRLENTELAAGSLCNYVDARDVADFLGRLLSRIGEIPPASTFFVGAADALAQRPLSELLPRHRYDLGAAAAGLTGTQPAFSTDKARRLLGWEPQRSWRTELTH